MSLDRTTLLGIAQAERQRLGRTVQFADPQTWEQPSALPGWWNRDVMAHLAAQDTAAAHVVKGDPPEELEEYRRHLDGRAFTVDRFNEWAVERRSGLPTREVLVTWGQAADALLGYAGLLSEDEWDKGRFPWLAGEIAARYLIHSRIVEWWVHGEDMRATNGLGPEYQHWPIHLTIDMGIRMLPWALAEAGLDLTGYSVEVEVDGAGGGRWHWGLGAGEVPPADTKPDTTIVGRAPHLALV
ncbi:MAG TPA: maleylpyruvate isomerase family mycothiol-dependent enzyme, partial [Actinomycetota bacterium]|nr:maleylpyruvate isomerase family mycothiol-dependent enzyme [Actinomycetota bacterium]